jgi:hypothetical protein
VGYNTVLNNKVLFIACLFCRFGKVKDQESGSMGSMMVSLFNMSHILCEKYGLLLAPMKRGKHFAGFSPLLSTSLISTL